LTHIKQQKFFVTSKAVDLIKTVYYIHGPWRDRRNFCCFICVNYGPYTLSQNDSFFYIYIINEPLHWLLKAQ